LVAAGSALGGIARYWCSAAVGARSAGVFPWGTVLVNIVGAVLIGVVMAWLQTRRDAAEAWQLFLVTGVLGGYTTFSAFSWQTFELLRNQQYLLAGANVVASVLLCLLAVGLGYWAASVLTR
jgi:fluoride exporter